MTCFTILLHHYRVYTCVIVIFILAIQPPVNAVSEYICPNKFTDIIGAKCYSLHTEWPEFWYKYNDAVEYCKKNGGTLLSKTTEQEVDFLRELYTKINSWSYWVSGYRYNEEWKYLGDNASIPMRLIKQNSEPDKCLAIKLSKNELVPVTCDYNSYYICVYSGEECEQDLCYQISFTKENVSGAITKCNQVGYKGHLVEIRNEEELAFYKNVIRKSRKAN